MGSLLLTLACLSCVGILANGESIYGRSLPHVLSRSKRSTTCAARFKLVSGHTACLDGRDASAVSAADKQLIVNKHNQYRAGVTPTASNMMKLRWDDEVAMLAQKWADQCPGLKHDENGERNIPGRFSVGQNIALNTHDWTAAIDLWYDEVRDFTYGNQNANEFGKIAHYTQVTWAETTLVGCGVKVCNGQNTHICNYGMAGNLFGRIHEPYKSGTSCADCPGHCVDSKLCDCNLTCLNGAALDPATCTCTCKASAPLYLAPDCALNCTGTSDESWCEAQGSCPGQHAWCPHKCNYCPYAAADYADPAAPTTTLKPSATTPAQTVDDSGDPDNGATKSVTNVAISVLSLFLFFLFV